MSTAMLKPSSDVLVRHMPGGAVLVHLSTNRIYELNDTAARVWELVSEGQLDRQALVDQLTGEFDADAARVSQEVGAVLDHWSHEGLLSAP